MRLVFDQPHFVPFMEAFKNGLKNGGKKPM